MPLFCQAMKAIYLALTSISLFLMAMINVMTFATTPEEATAFDLQSVPALWRIEVLEDNWHFSKADESELKRHVLGFFNQAGTPTYKRLDHYSVCFCLIFMFAVFGYFRERYLAKDRSR